MRLIRLTVFLYFILALGVIKNLAHASDALVFQREYIYTQANMFTNIQTGGINTCVGVVLYQESDKSAVLAHIDATVDPMRAIDKLLSQFTDTKNIKAWVYGGIAESPVKLFENILVAFEKNDIKVVKSAQNKSSSESMSLRLNLRSGEVFVNDNRYIDIDYRTRIGKVNRLKFGRGLYRHHLSIGGGDDPLIFAPMELEVTGFPGRPF